MGPAPEARDPNYNPNPNHNPKLPILIFFLPLSDNRIFVAIMVVKTH